MKAKVENCRRFQKQMFEPRQFSEKTIAEKILKYELLVDICGKWVKSEITSIFRMSLL